ncbi:MAG: hypothetical protein H6R18_2455 [Proteobacteria bacterium]|nr:hypothetical protein [Pseudomonadota bacterium]
MSARVAAQRFLIFSRGLSRLCAGGDCIQKAGAKSGLFVGVPGGYNERFVSGAKRPEFTEQDHEFRRYFPSH